MSNTQNTHANVENASANETHVMAQLPADIVDMIFSWVPIKRAMQIGVLAKRFKKTWMFCQRLDFGIAIARHLKRSEYVAIISRVFELHQASNIKSFSLYLNPIGVEPLVRTWMEIAMTKGVEELDLDFFGASNHLPFPLDLTSIDSVRILKLSFCCIDFPPMLSNLRLLETLVLSRARLQDDLILAVIQNCKLLEKLVLIDLPELQNLCVFAQNLKRFRELHVIDCFGLYFIEINAPTLQSFYFTGIVPSLSFANISRLSDAVLNIATSRGLKLDNRIKDIIWDLVHLRTLTVSTSFLEDLCPTYEGGTLQRMRFSLLHLTEVQLLMENAIYCNLYDIALFLMSCPCVERLFIDLNGCPFESSVYWKMSQKQVLGKIPWIFNHLKVIRVVGFRCQVHELELAEYFLKRTPNLEALVLIATFRNYPKRILLPLPVIYQKFVSMKASQRAWISMYQYSEELCPIQPLHRMSTA